VSANEIFALADDFAQAAGRVAEVLYDVYDEGGRAFAEDWAKNAAETSGEHGKHYPNSIDHETRVSLGIRVEVGPNSAKKQGTMGRGFELGSVNQPPHLDGLRALAIADQRIARMADSAIGFMLP